MPNYAVPEGLTEDLRIRITLPQRVWLEQQADAQERSINSIVRRLVEQAMRTTAEEDAPHVD